MPQYEYVSENLNVLLFYNFRLQLRNVETVGCVSPSSKITEDLIRIKETKTAAKNVFNFLTRNWTFKTITGLELLDIVNLKWIWHFYCIAQRSEKGIKVPKLFLPANIVLDILRQWLQNRLLTLSKINMTKQNVLNCIYFARLCQSEMAVIQFLICLWLNVFICATGFNLDTRIPIVKTGKISAI